MESDLSRRIDGIRNQIDMSADKRNTIIRVNRAAKTALEVFDDILQKPKLERQDLTLIIERITVFEDHIEVQQSRYRLHPQERHIAGGDGDAANF